MMTIEIVDIDAAFFTFGTNAYAAGADAAEKGLPRTAIEGTLYERDDYARLRWGIGWCTAKYWAAKKEGGDT